MEVIYLNTTLAWQALTCRFVESGDLRHSQRPEIGDEMSKTRMFLNQESRESVICQFNDITGSWRCSSSLTSQYQVHSNHLQPLLKELVRDGFQELRPHS